MVETSVYCRDSYPQFLEYLVDSKDSLKGVAKWEIEIGCFIDYYICTKSSKSHTRQYHLLHKSRVTTVDLVKWNLKADEMCTFCRSSPESVIRMFLKCTVSCGVWNSLQQWLRQQTGITLLKVYLIKT